MPAAAKQFHISAAFPFIPRQIMLQNPPITACQEEKKRRKEEKKRRKEEKKAKKRSSETLDAAPAALETLDAAPAAPETLDLHVAANGGGQGPKGKERKLLLRSISAYLESNGFTKTLAIFKSEAELPTDGGKASILNLEDLFCKFLESSKSSEDATADRSKEQDSVPGDGSHVKKKDKKKRKSAFDPVGENYAEGTHGMTSTVPENDEKQKQKKISKMSSDSFNGKHEPGDKVKSQELVEGKVEELTILSSTPAAESNPKVSGEKRKKTKRGSGASAGNVEEIDTGEFVEGNKKKSKDLKSLGSDSKTDSELLNSVTVDTSIKDASLNADSKSKGKKKKRDRTISETLHSVESYQVDGGMSNDVGGDTAGHTTTDVLENIDPTKEISEQNIDNLKVSKKRKKLALEERVLEYANVVESTDSKHTRVDGAEEKKKRGIHQNLDMSLPDSEDLSVSKKQKKEKSYENSSEDVKTSFDQQISVSIEHKDNSGGYDSPKQANGNLEKESEGLSSKKLKKEKRSAEPTSNAFRRVKLEEVEFVDERLQNNSYWAKGGADSGYGAKAQEILGQVKGRNFRHEKTKKKRGSYRGGQIDLQSHSIKFNYSDEE